MAREVSITAIRIYRELDDDFSSVWPKMNLAWSMLLDGDPAAGRALFAENVAFMNDEADSTVDVRLLKSSRSWLPATPHN